MQATAHSYEELREIVIQILAEPRRIPGSQFSNLEREVAEFLEKRGQGSGRKDTLGGTCLSGADANKLLEVFWDLFRQGIITLGADSSNPQFPFFRVTEHGKRIVSSRDPYFFHDLSSYVTVVTHELPDIDEVTLLYLKEAMQAFMSGCLLSTSVMLGVAIENAFTQLLERIDASSQHASLFNSAIKQRTLLQRFNKFNQIVNQHRDLLQPSTREDLETNFGSILALIRTFRNESGHPSGRIISREQAYVLLHLIIPCCKKVRELELDLC